MFEPLLTYEEGAVVPHLLDRFEQSKDGRTWTLTLKDGLRFHPHPCLSETESTPAGAEKRRRDPLLR